MCAFLVTQTVACLVAECKFTWFLMCTLLVTQTVPCIFSGGMLAWFLMYTLLVTKTVTCLVLEGELAWFLVCALLVTQTGLSCFRLWVGLVLLCTLLVRQIMASLVSGGEFAWFWCAFFCWHRLWPVLFQWVSWPDFSMCAFLVTQTVTCLLSGGVLACFFHVHSLVTQTNLLCFRRWVVLVYHVHSAGDTLACLILEGELSWFLLWTLLVTLLFQEVSFDHELLSSLIISLDFFQFVSYFLFTVYFSAAHF